MNDDVTGPILIASVIILIGLALAWYIAGRR